MTRVEIRNNATGEVRDCSEQFTDDEIGGEFMWSEGNYSCDCNRELFFARVNNEPEDWESDTCGDSRYGARLTAPDGTRIYSDFAEDIAGGKTV